jgi:single-strand DNA-binding protein
MGNLTRDPDVRYTPKGTAVTEIGLAVNRHYTGDDGEKKEEVTFVDVTLWGRQAEVAGQFLKKGRPVFIEGRLQLETWDDKQTHQKRSKLKVVAENLQLLGSKPGEGDAHSQESSAPQPSKALQENVRGRQPVDQSPRGTLTWILNQTISHSDERQKQAQSGPGVDKDSGCSNGARASLALAYCPSRRGQKAAGSRFSFKTSR